MKKLLLISFALLSLQGMRAQRIVDDFGVFHHFSVGGTLGTTGIGIEVATPITRFFQLRAGFDYLSDFKYKTDVNYKERGNKRKTEVEAEIDLSAFLLLLDFYPMKNIPLHATFGAYMGASEIVNLKNNDPIVGLAPGEGLEIGDYIVSPDDKGIARASIEVKKFRPYLGIGYGRAVAKKRLSVSGDLGVQFWGTPKVYENMTGTKQQITSKDTGNNDKNFINNISKITVYPVLTIRVAGRIL